jgi:hypothetical protein
MVRAGRRQLEGVVTVTIDGRKQLLGPGEAVFIPHGSVQHQENLHEGRTRTLAVMTPGAIGRRYFEDLAEVINVPGKPGLANAKQIMLRHGLIPVYWSQRTGTRLCWLIARQVCVVLLAASRTARSRNTWPTRPNPWQMADVARTRSVLGQSRRFWCVGGMSSYAPP